MPSKVETTIEINGNSLGGKLGDSFSFQAPTDATGSIEGKATYDLEGDLKVIYSLAPIGSVGAEILSASGKLSDGFTQREVKFGPAWKPTLSGSSDLLSIKLFEQDIAIPDELIKPVSRPFHLASGSIGRWAEHQFFRQTG